MIAEVIKLIETASGKTSSFDLMQTSILKSFTALAGMIDNVADSSVSAARFPQSVKTGLVTPLLKKPSLDTTDFKNFRSITNLTINSKIIDKLALHRLRSHLVSSSNPGRLQSAYFTG